MALNWLRLDANEHVLAGRWGLGEETIRKERIQGIVSLKGHKITWIDYNDKTAFVAFVDGTHCRIYEQRTDPASKWFSKKTMDLPLPTSKPAGPTSTVVPQQKKGGSRTSWRVKKQQINSTADTPKPKSENQAESTANTPNETTKLKDGTSDERFEYNGHKFSYE